MKLRFTAFVMGSLLRATDQFEIPIEEVERIVLGSACLTVHLRIGKVLTVEKCDIVVIP